MSTDTQEMYYSSKCKQFLIDQGYSYRVVTDLDGMGKAEWNLDSKEEELELISKVRATDDRGVSEGSNADVNECYLPSDALIN